MLCFSFSQFENITLLLWTCCPYFFYKMNIFLRLARPRSSFPLLPTLYFLFLLPYLFPLYVFILLSFLSIGEHYYAAMDSLFLFAVKINIFLCPARHRSISSLSPPPLSLFFSYPLYFFIFLSIREHYYAAMKLCSYFQ